MNPFKARLLSYLCLGLALALAVPPLFHTDARREHLTGSAVFSRGMALSGQKLESVCGTGEIPRLGDQALAAYPDVAKALGELRVPGSRTGGVVFLKSEGPARLAAELGRADRKELCFRRGAESFLMRVAKAGSIWSSYLAQVGADPDVRLGAPDLDSLNFTRWELLPAWLCRRMPACRRAPGDAESHRSLHRYQDLREPFYRERPSSAPLDAWRPFLDRIRAKDGQTRFVAGDYLVSLAVREHSRWVTTELPGLAWGRMIVGAALLVVGLLLLRQGYGKRPGIAINPVGAIVFGDAAFVLAMGVLTAGPLYYVLENWLGLVRPFSEMNQALQFTLSIMYPPCLFIFAGMASNMGGQSLEAGEKGVTMHGPLGSRFMPWQEIAGLDLRETHVMTGRVGVLVPRRLQTKLVFRLSDEGSVEMFEPGTNSRKGRILTALGRYAPARLADDLARIGRQW